VSSAPLRVLFVVPGTGVAGTLSAGTAEAVLTGLGVPAGIGFGHVSGSVRMATTTHSRNRWDTDERFVSWPMPAPSPPAVEELARLARRPGWVTEDP
jgi:hypothetical protein